VGLINQKIPLNTDPENDRQALRVRTLVGTSLKLPCHVCSQTPVAMYLVINVNSHCCAVMCTLKHTPNRRQKMG
jgi:hypothetical protein